MPGSAGLSSQGGPMSMMSTNQQQLRRAAYVSVMQLTSPYSVDPQKLEEELKRVKEEQEKLQEAPAAHTYDGVPTEFDTSQKRLQPPRGGYNLCLLVGKVEVVVDKNRVDGSRVRLAEVIVGDDTGCVSLRARDEQIDVLAEVSQRSGAMVLRNCTLELYQGRHIRLAVTKWGKMSTYPDNVQSTPTPPSKMNLERNFSLIDLSRVATVFSGPPSKDEHDSASYGYQHHGGHHHQHHHQHGNNPGGNSGGGRGHHHHHHHHQGRRGGGNRRAGRGGRSHGGGMNPQVMHQQPQQMYTDSNPAMRYPPPGGLHGYGTGYMEGSHHVDPQHFPYLRHQDARMHMMQQQQQQQLSYDMHRSMYQQPNDRQSAASPMMLQSGHYRQDMQMAMSSPFMGSPQAPMYPPPAAHTQTTATGDRPPSYDPTQSPRMNPKAPTFDPNK